MHKIMFILFFGHSFIEKRKALTEPKWNMKKVLIGLTFLGGVLALCAPDTGWKHKIKHLVGLNSIHLQPYRAQDGKKYSDGHRCNQCGVYETSGGPPVHPEFKESIVDQACRRPHELWAKKWRFPFHQHRQYQNWYATEYHQHPDAIHTQSPDFYDQD